MLQAQAIQLLLCRQTRGGTQLRFLRWLRWLVGAVELRNEIGRAVGSELPGTLVYDYPTIASIVAFLLPKTIAAAQGPDTQLSIPDHLR